MTNISRVRIDRFHGEGRINASVIRTGKPCGFRFFGFLVAENMQLILKTGIYSKIYWKRSNGIRKYIFYVFYVYYK